MVHAWKVVVRDKGGKVIPMPDGSGKEMKLLVCGKQVQLPDKTWARLPCEFQTEQAVCDHVREHYANLTPISAYDADKDEPALLMPVPPASFQFGILDSISKLQNRISDAAHRIPRRLIPRSLIQPRTHRS